MAPHHLRLPLFQVSDPSRNYYTVDLRPSPASKGDGSDTYARTVVYRKCAAAAAAADTDAIDTSGSVSANSGGTVTYAADSGNGGGGGGSSNDLATLIRDATCDQQTEQSAVAICPRRIIPCQPAPIKTACSAPATHRRHSHSLSSVPSETRELNYVYVIPSSTSGVEADDHSRSVVLHPDSSYELASSLPGAGGAGSSSSSGLGAEHMSYSVTPPLAVGRGGSMAGEVAGASRSTCTTGFSELLFYPSRSMTSSATSATSGDGIRLMNDSGSSSGSPPTMDSSSGAVAYTEIDFTRTLALRDTEQDLAGSKLSSNSAEPARSWWWSAPKEDRSWMHKMISRAGRKRQELNPWKLK